MKVIRSIIFFTTVLSFLMISSFYLLRFFATNATSKTIISPVIESVKKSEEKILSFFSSGLEEAVNKALEGSRGTYSIVIKNLKTGEAYSRNPENVYSTASLYKLWVMSVAYEQIEQGKLKKEQVLTEDARELNRKFDIASESAELTEGAVSYSIADAIEKAITVSDNYASLLLTSKLRVSTISTFLKQEGFNKSSVGTPPKTSAPDITLFFEKIYKRELVNKEASDDMLEILKRQELNDRIPKYLPKDIAVAHKTGELETVKHDAGIVFTPQGDYIIVMLSQSNNPQAASERMARISQNVYEYFLKQR